MLALLILLLFTVRITFAQTATAQPESKWWWAWRESSHELIAFDAEGDTNVIAVNVRLDYRLARINDDTALAILQSGSDYALYKLTPQSAIPLSKIREDAFTPDLAVPSTFGLIQVKWPYALFTGVNRTLWVVDLTTNTLQPLDRQLGLDNARCGFSIASVSGIDRCANISRDARYVRYVAAASPAEPDVLFVLRERELSTGVEHNFYIMPKLLDGNDMQVNCEVGTGAYTQQWLCDRDSNVSNYDLHSVWMVSPDGTTRTLVEQSLSGDLWRIYYSHDNLIVQNLGCKENCLIEVRSSTDYVSETFNLPATGLSPYDYSNVVPISGEKLLFYASLSAYILGTSGNIQRLGSIYCCEYIPTESPDFHWIVLNSEDGTKAVVWDLETNQAKFQVQNVDPPMMLYTDEGFVISNKWVYFNGADSLLELPPEATGFIVDTLPDHALIYEQREDSKTLVTGIYRYDTESKTYTPLVPGATFQFGT